MRIQCQKASVTSAHKFLLSYYLGQKSKYYWYITFTSLFHENQKGLGYAEIEWAILHELGVVDQSTIVITTVHQSQIVSDEVFSQNLQTSHDLPVDIIITPRKIINVKPKIAKPSCGIIWEQINKDHLSSLSILKIWLSSVFCLPANKVRLIIWLSL